MANTINLAGGPALRPRGSEDWRPGLVMALAAHGLLLLALLFSVNWRTTQRETVEAEMWSEIPTAATRTAPPEETTPVPAPAPVEAPPPPPPPPAPAPEPAPEPIPAEVQTHKEPPKPVKTKPPREVFDSTPPKPAPAEPKAATKPSPAPPPPGATAAERERARKDALARMMADLGGPALSSAGPSADYGARIRARIKPNIVFTETVNGNPLATVEVRCAPDGRIIGRRLITSSGAAAWDDAVLRAIDRTEVLPRDEKGKVQPVMLLEFRPQDF